MTEAALVLILPGKKGPTSYYLEKIDAHPEMATAAWRLRKAFDQDEVYDVRRMPNGWLLCSCKDAESRLKLIGCKHCQGLVKKGLL